MKRMIIGIITCVLCFNSLFTVAKTVMAEEKITMTPIIRENNNGIEYDGEQEEAATAIDTETVFQTQQYMSYYFKNLTDNFGWNVKGSCGYVAMGMLLSYWDTYWNDNIVAEQYEIEAELESAQITTSVESPGAIREPENIADESLTAEEYYQKITENSNIYLHLRLMQIGQVEYQLYDFTSDEAPAGLDDEEYAKIMNHYLYKDRRFSQGTIGFDTFKSYDSEEVRQYAIYMLKQGVPVKLGVQGPSGRHAVIAYDYDEENDTIYVHSGLKNDEGSAMTHVTINDIGYNIYKNVMAIVLYDGFLHDCSNNYYYANENNEVTTYCPCSLEMHGKKQAIVYHNLDFGNQTAIVIKDNSIRKHAPTTYQHGVGLDLSNITAYMSAEGAYSPRMIFLGWTNNEFLNGSVTNISTTQAGTMHLYAKWRYDYTTAGRIGTHVIDSFDFYTQEYDQIYIGDLGSQATDLRAMGMEYLALKIKINMWEMTDIPGQDQYIYVYDQYHERANRLARQEIKSIDETFDTTPTPNVIEIVLYIDLYDLEGLDYIYICYGSSSYMHPWASDRMYAEMMCIVERGDENKAPDFYFSNDDPFV